MPKTIIITGANGNLGVATVMHLLREGYQVIGIDHANHHLEPALSNPLFEWHAADLTDEQGMSQLVSDCLARHKKVDGALMLAGGFEVGDVQATDGSRLAKMYTLNFESAYFLARPLYRHMLDNHYGRLVFIGARPALIAAQGTGCIAYALTKAMLFELADLLNAGAKGTNVVAAVVAPSTIDTPVNRQSMPDADPSDWVKPEQIAAILGQRQTSCRTLDQTCAEMFLKRCDLTRDGRLRRSCRDLQRR